MKGKLIRLAEQEGSEQCATGTERMLGASSKEKIAFAEGLICFH